LARKYHPDLHPDDDQAEKKFKEANEAYEVLKDPEKRKLYDQLGPDWEQGQHFQRPPGFENVRFHFGGGPGGGPGGGAAGFSDFFEDLFGGGGGFSGFGGGGGARGGFGPQGFSRRPSKGSDAEAGLDLTLEEAYRGGSKTISLREQGMGPDGRPQVQTKNLDVTIPSGVRDGARIRLAGQGNPGPGGGPSGDLYLKVRILPHRLFKLKGDNIVLDLPLTPWEAALGATVTVPTLEKSVEMTVPAGVGSGQKLRLRGRGLGSDKRRGDQLVRVMIKVPKDMSDAERDLMRQLSEASNFNPRKF
jgi:curved DNA-binding protein